MAFDERVARVRRMLATLKTKDPACAQFGAEKHRYEVEPSLSEQEIESFERAHGVALPAEYRAFVLSIGSGGAGPGYGLERLSAITRESDVPRPRPRSLRDVGDRRFAYWAATRELIASQGCAAQPFGREHPFIATETTTDAELDSALARSGTLLLADYGCAIEARLVVNGPLRGDVWVLDGSAMAYVPFHMQWGLHGSAARELSDGGVEFLAWYEHWLEAALGAPG